MVQQQVWFEFFRDAKDRPVPIQAYGRLFTGENSLGGIAAAQLQFSQIGKVDYITGDASTNPISVTDQLVQQGLIDTLQTGD